MSNDYTHFCGLCFLGHLYWQVTTGSTAVTATASLEGTLPGKADIWLDFTCTEVRAVDPAVKGRGARAVRPPFANFASFAAQITRGNESPSRRCC